MSASKITGIQCNGSSDYPSLDPEECKKHKRSPSGSALTGNFATATPGAMTPGEGERCDEKCCLIPWDPRKMPKGKKHHPVTWSRFWRKPIERPWWFWSGILICLVFAFVTVFFFEDVCIATEPFEISFKFDRSLTESPCKPGAPCNLYLTFGEQMETAMIVNFHTRQPLKDPLVYYDTHSRDSLSSYRFVARGMTVKMDLEEDRYVHWVELQGLKPDTKYFFRAGGEEEDPEDDSEVTNEWYSPERWFLTAPKEEPFTYVSGGDIGLTPGAKKLLEQAGEVGPLFIGLGGDIAYETGFKACYRRFDRWFAMYDKASSRDGRMIPMLPTIGNHEGGFLLENRQDFPFYFDYFPMQYGYVHPEERMSFHKHLFGRNTLFLALDSGHLAAPDHQVGFMQNAVREHPERTNRILFYHVPLIPSAAYDEDPDLRQELRDSWEKPFQKLGFTVAFQHHDHSYGRFKHAEGDDAPYYITAGGMGASPSDLSEDTNEFEVLSKAHHMVIVTVRPHEIKVEAVDKDNNIFDTIIIPSSLRPNTLP